MSEVWYLAEWNNTSRKRIGFAFYLVVFHQHKLNTKPLFLAENPPSVYPVVLLKASGGHSHAALVNARCVLCSRALKELPQIFCSHHSSFSVTVTGNRRISSVLVSQSP